MEEKGIRQEERATATTDMGKEGITAQENRETGVSPAGKEKERRKREPENRSPRNNCSSAGNCWPIR